MKEEGLSKSHLFTLEQRPPRCTDYVNEKAPITDGAPIIYTDREQGVDGVMVGTGVFKNPWMFNQQLPDITMEMRIALIRKHIMLYDSVWEGKQNYNVLKRFYKIYINGFEGAADWRDQLMRTTDCAGALEVVRRMVVSS